MRPHGHSLASVVGGMNAKRVIPATPLFLRYRGFKETDEQQRLAQALHFAEHPQELAREFAESVEHFGSYDNRQEPFYDKRGADPISPGGRIGATHHLAFGLGGKRNGRTPGEGDRLAVSLPESVVSVPAENLGFEYVEREVTVTRTKLAEWEHGQHGRSRFSLDLLLSAVDGRVPVAAEVKIAGDRDSWYAFIQALASLACLATPPQYERLRNHLNERGQWPELHGGRPMLDLYLLFVDSPKTGRYRDAITAATAHAAVGLLGEEARTGTAQNRWARLPWEWRARCDCSLRLAAGRLNHRGQAGDLLRRCGEPRSLDHWVIRLRRLAEPGRRRGRRRRRGMRASRSKWYETNSVCCPLRRL